MAHFAQLDQNNIVIGVYPIADSNCLDENGNESEQVGINYCKSFYGQDTNWKQTSYNRKIRKNYAGIGYSYNEDLDAFIPPKPHYSWILNTEICDWEPSVSQPELTEEQKQSGSYYEWSGQTESWELKIVSVS